MDRSEGARRIRYRQCWRRRLAAMAMRASRAWIDRVARVSSGQVAWSQRAVVERVRVGRKWLRRHRRTCDLYFGGDGTIVARSRMRRQVLVVQPSQVSFDWPISMPQVLLSTKYAPPRRSGYLCLTVAAREPKAKRAVAGARLGKSCCSLLPDPVLTRTRGGLAIHGPPRPLGEKKKKKRHRLARTHVTRTFSAESLTSVES